MEVASRSLLSAAVRFYCRCNPTSVARGCRFPTAAYDAQDIAALSREALRDARRLTLRSAQSATRFGRCDRLWSRIQRNRLRALWNNASAPRPHAMANLFAARTARPSSTLKYRAQPGVIRRGLGRCPRRHGPSARRRSTRENERAPSVRSSRPRHELSLPLLDLIGQDSSFHCSSAQEGCARYNGANVTQ